MKTKIYAFIASAMIGLSACGGGGGGSPNFTPEELARIEERNQRAAQAAEINERVRLCACDVTFNYEVLSNDDLTLLMKAALDNNDMRLFNQLRSLQIVRIQAAQGGQ